MAAGYDLKEGKYDQTYMSSTDIKNMLTFFFENTSKKESTYKYAMFKSIIDNMDIAMDRTYNISFDQLFVRFSEIYWVLVFKHKIPQKVPSSKAPQTLAEKIIEDTAIKYGIQKETEFHSLSERVQREVIKQMKKKCSRYVFGALYAETNRLLYSFSKEKECIELNPLVVNYIQKHEKTVQMQNYKAWGSFYVNIISLEEKERGYYQHLLKCEFGDGSVISGVSLSLDIKNKTSIKKEVKKTFNTLSYAYDFEIAIKARKVLSQYPDLGLYLNQICDKTGVDKEKLRIVLDNSFWSRREGCRYFYIDLPDSDIVTEAMFEGKYLTAEMEKKGDMKSVDTDMEKIQLLDNPELLIKRLKKEKGIISESEDIILKNKSIDENKRKRTLSSVQKEWEREEVVILVTEYFRTKTMSAEKIEESLYKISKFLRKREEQISGVLVDDTFRNYAGIRMQNGRIRCLDPETKYDGMKGTKLQSEIVEEYLANPQKLKNEAETIIQKYGGTL